MDVKVGFLFEHKGSMCRKVGAGAYRFCHPTDAALNGSYGPFVLGDREPVRLYLAENGLRMEGRFVVRV